MINVYVRKLYILSLLQNSQSSTIKVFYDQNKKPTLQKDRNKLNIARNVVHDLWRIGKSIFATFAQSFLN